MADALEIKVRIAENELRREAEAAGQTVRAGIGSSPIAIAIDTGSSSSDLQALTSEVLAAQAALSDGTEAVELQKQAALLQESLRFKQQLASIDGAGLSAEDANNAKRLATELNKVNVERLERDFDDLKQSAQRSIGGIQGLLSNLVEGVGQGLGQRLTDTAFGFLGGIGDQFSQVVEKGSNLESISIAFETITGSAEAGQKAIEDLVNFAASTPFELPEIQKSGQSLLAFGFEAENLVETLGRVGNVAAGVSAPIDELAIIYGKARVSGRLFAEDINQLTERGIPIIQELAKQFGVTEGEVRGLVESGQVGFGNLEQAFIDLTSEGGSFFNLMEAQSASVGGKISNFSDNVGKLQTSLFGAIQPVLKTSLNASIALLDIAIKLVDGFLALPAPIKLTLLAVTGFTAALAAGVVALTAYQIASQTVGAQLLKQNIAQIQATIAQSKETIATAAGTVAKTAYAVATGKATAAQLQFVGAVAKGAATLGLLAVAAGAVIAVVDTFKSVDAAASNTRDQTDQLRDSLEKLGDSQAAQEMSGLAGVIGGELSSDIERAREELNLFQRTLDDLIRGPIPGLATAAEASANRNTVAFGELTGEVDNVLNIFDRFRAQGLEGQSEEDIASLTEAIDQAQASIESSAIPENMRASAEIYIESLERARDELTALQQQQQAPGAQGTVVGGLFEEGQERVEAERDARLDAIDQVNQLEASERERNQTDAIAAVRAQAAARVISEEEAQRQIAAIQQQGLADELASVEAQLAQVEQLRADRVISAEDAAQQIADLESQASNLRLEQIEAAAAAEEAAVQARLSAIQEALQLEESERGRAQTEAIAAVQEQVAARVLSEEDAQRQIAEIRRQGIDDELASVQRQIAQVQQLRTEGILESGDATQQLADLEAEAANLRLEQVEADIDAQNDLRDIELERLDEISEREQSLAEERSAALEAQLEGLQQESDLLSARAGLEQAQSDLSNQRLSQRIQEAEAAGNARLAEQLTSQLLEQQTVQLAEQQEVEREQLRLSQEQAAIELQRQSVLAAIATLDAEIAIQQAIANDASAAELENLERALSLREQQEQFVADQAAAQEQLNQLANQELSTRQQIAREAQAAAREAESSALGGGGGGRGGASGGGGTGGLLGREVALYQEATRELQELIRGGADLRTLVGFGESGDAQQRDIRQRALANSAAADVLQFVQPVSQSEIAAIVGTETARNNARLNDTLQSLNREIANLGSSPRSVTVQSANPLGEVGNVISQLQQAESRAFGL